MEQRKDGIRSRIASTSASRGSSASSGNRLASLLLGSSSSSGNGSYRHPHLLHYCYQRLSRPLWLVFFVISFSCNDVTAAYMAEIFVSRYVCTGVCIYINMIVLTCIIPKSSSLWYQITWTSKCCFLVCNAPQAPQSGQL